MEKLIYQQRQALERALQVISRTRIAEICRLTHWQSGGCLSQRKRPDIAEVTAEEDQAIRSLWHTLQGTSCWMTAVYLIRNHQKEPSDG